MLVTSPIIRIWQCISWPKLAQCKHFLQFLDERLPASEELNQSFSIMRHCKSIMPCIPFHIIIGEDVDSLLFAELDESAIFVFRIEEFSGFVP